MSSPAEAVTKSVTTTDYDAFLSYAHHDRAVATAIQKGLHQIGRRLGQLRALRVFRDDTNLTASPDLWGRITDALGSARFMIVVLSPQSAASHWVNEEISHWLTHHGNDHLMLVLAAGEVSWDETQKRFDPERSNAAPPALTEPGSLPVEPLYIDVSQDQPWDLRSPLFRDKLTALAAPVHGKAKDQLSGDDLREQRSFRRLRAAAVAGLAVLTVVALVAAWVAVDRQHTADARMRDAVVAKLNAEAGPMLAGLTPGGDVRALQELLAANAIEANGVPILDAQIARFTTQKIIDTGSRPIRLAYSPDGHRIATAQSDGTVRQWDSTTYQAIGSPLKGRTAQATDVAYTPDGREIASAGTDGFRLLDASTGARLNPNSTGSDRPHLSVAVNPHDEIAVTGDNDNTLETWSTRTGELLKSATVFTDFGTADRDNPGIIGIAYDRAGTMVTVSSMNGQIGIFDAKTGELKPPVLETKNNHGIPVPAWQVAVSPDGRTLAVAADDLQLWDLATRTLTRRIQLDPSPMATALAVVYSPDGHRVATGRSDGVVQLWDVGTGAQLGATMSGQTGAVLGIAFRPDGRQLATTSIDGTLRLWSATVGQLMRGSDNTFDSVAFSPDGHRVAASGSAAALQQWDLDSGQPRRPVPLLGAATFWFAFTTSGKAVTAGYDGTVAVLNQDTGQPVQSPVRLPVPAHTFIKYAASEDGRNIAWWVDDEKTVHLSDVATGRDHGRPLNLDTAADGKFAPNSRIDSVAFSPDGHHLAVGYGDGLWLWNTDSDQLEGSPMTDPGPVNGVTAVAFSRDGSTVAAGRGDDTIELWDIPTRKQRSGSPLRGHTAVATRLAFGPGHQLASSTAEGSIRLWDTATGAPTAAPIERKDTVRGVALSPDGRLVASITEDGTLLLSPALADPGQLCDKLPANMTHKQWRDWISPGIDYITVCPNLPVPQD